MRSLLQSLKRTHWTPLILILCLGGGAFLRLYNFNNTLQFLGDQGRDAIIAKQILIDHHPALIGPVTSTGNMYLGPLYYYFMVPFLAMTYPNPIGPAYAIAVLSIATIGLMYLLGREMVGERPALIATLLAAFSAMFVSFAHFSWNPNPAPFVSIMLVWATYRAITKKTWYWLLVGLCLAVLIQLHYITLLCIPAAGLLWLNELRKSFRISKKSVRSTKQLQLILSGIGIVLIFIISLIPLIAFDIRHQFTNSQAFIHFITADLGPNQSSLISRIGLVLDRLFLRANQIFFQEFIWSNILISSLAILGFVISLVMICRRQKKIPMSLQVLGTYLFISLLGLGYYRGAIYDHYLMYLLPMAMLCVGMVVNFWWTTKLGKMAVAALVICYVIGNLPNYHLQDRAITVSQIHQTADSILGRLKPGDKYNIVLISDDGDIGGQNYRYFLDVTKIPPQPEEKWGDIDKLYIINENHRMAHVTESPIYEIVTFPNKHPDEVYNIPNGPEITVLRR